MILSIAKFLISDFEKVFNMEFVGMCMIYLHANFHMPDKYNFMQPHFIVLQLHAHTRASTSLTQSLSLCPCLPLPLV